MTVAHCMLRQMCFSHSQGGSTALMFAASLGYEDCVRLLIDTGADKEAKNYVRVGRCFARSLPRVISHFLVFSAMSFVSFNIFSICPFFFLFFVAISCSYPCFFDHIFDFSSFVFIF
jgi:hypothetical protein